VECVCWSGQAQSLFRCDHENHPDPVATADDGIRVVRLLGTWVPME
jgi:hypothetical protein